MRDQRGMTLIELLVVAGLVAITVAVTVIASAPWIARESMRSAASNVVSTIQRAKIEAVSRNRDCRFVVDTAAGNLEIWDSLGTPSTLDDVLLHQAELPSVVGFARPDSGGVATLDPIATDRYQTVFASDGSVNTGVGGVYLQGGDGYGNVAVHAAGGTEVRYWNGTSWVAGY
jgi:prepilin-type N-terminal cleavage/methylation domain-containing protein